MNSTKLICSICKASDFGEGDAGEPVCNVCGTELVVGNTDRAESTFQAPSSQGGRTKIYQTYNVGKSFAPNSQQDDLDGPNSRAVSKKKKRKRVDGNTLPRTSEMYVKKKRVDTRNNKSNDSDNKRRQQMDKPQDVLLGYQWCLKTMLDALRGKRDKAGKYPHAIISSRVEQQVRTIWFCYLKELSARNVRIADIYIPNKKKELATKRIKLNQQVEAINSSASSTSTSTSSSSSSSSSTSTSSSSTSKGSKKNQKKSRRSENSNVWYGAQWKGLPQLNLMTLISMIYIGSKMWKESVLGSDLLRWIINGTLPYMQMYDRMKKSDQINLRRYRQLFRPKLPCRRGLRRIQQWKIGLSTYSSGGQKQVAWSFAVEQLGTFQIEKFRSQCFDQPSP